MIDVPLVLPWAVFVACWLLLGPVAVAMHRAARPALARLGPGQRGNVLLALAIAPIACGAAVAILGFTPAIGGYIVDAHCHADTGCRPHVPALRTEASIALWLVAAACLAVLTVSWTLVGNIRAGSALARALERLSQRRIEPRAGAQDLPQYAAIPAYSIVATADLFAYCAGVLRPRIVVSRGLLEALTPRQLHVVLAHENAHAERHDNLRRVLAGTGLWLVPRRFRRQLLGDLALAAELSCDRAAARVVGSAAEVIATLRALQCLKGRTGSRHAQSSGSSSVLAMRIDALTTPEAQVSRAALVLASGSTFAAVVLLTADLAHHGVEQMVSWAAWLN